MRVPSNSCAEPYIAGPVNNAFGQTTLVRLPPNGVTSLAADGSAPQSYVARVRPEGDIVFWVLILPMSVQDLRLDPQGNLWAAGIATRSPSTADVTPCFSAMTPSVERGASAPAVARIASDGRSAPLFQCVGRGWQFPETPPVRIGFDINGQIHLAGGATGYRGFTATANAARSAPADLATNPSYATLSTPYAIRLDALASSIDWATWLPADRLSAMAVDAAGNLTFGMAADESRPAATGSGGGAILRTQDGGRTWQNAAAGLPGAPAGVVVARRNGNALLAWTSSWIAWTSDGGRSWSELPPPSEGSAMVRSMAIDDSGQVAYLLDADYLNGHRLRRFRDGQWTLLETPATLNLPAAVLATGADSTVYLFQGGIWHSADGGDSWLLDAPDGSGVRLAVHPADGRTVYRVAPGPVGSVYQQTTDFGRNWTTYNMPGNSVTTAGNDPNVLVVVSGPNLYRSTDAGQHWQTYAGLTCPGARPNPAGGASVLCLGAGAAVKVDLATRRSTLYQPILGNGPILNVLTAAGSFSQLYLLRTPRMDGLVCQLQATGSQFNFCANLGGLGDDGVTHLIPATGGGFWVAGATTSRDFPVSPRALGQTVRFATDDTDFLVTESTDTFLCKLAADGRSWTACTVFGGSSDESAAGLAEDAQRRPVLFGNTTSWDFPAAGGGKFAPYTQQQTTFSFLSSGFVLRADAGLTQASYASVFASFPIGAAAAAGADVFAYTGKDSAYVPDDYLGRFFPTAVSASIGALDFSGALAMDVAPYGLREAVLFNGLSLTPGGVVAMSGAGLATSTATGTTDPLPRVLGTTQVLLDGQTSPLVGSPGTELEFAL